MGQLLRRLLALFGSPTPEQYPVKVCPNCQALIRTFPCQICRYINNFSPITLLDYFMGHNTDPRYRAELTSQVMDNATDLLQRVNALLSKFVSEVGVLVPPITSGWRPAAYNASIGGAKSSRHISGQAIDLSDDNRVFGDWLLNNQQELISRNLAIEMLDYTIKANGHKWVHIQSVIPPSGRHIFQPYSGPPKIT